VVTKKPEKDSVQARGSAGFPASGVGALSFSKKLDTVAVTGSVSYQNTSPTDLASEFPGDFAIYKSTSLPRTSDLSTQQFDKGLNAFLRGEVGNTSLQLMYRQSGRNSGGPGDPFGRFSNAGWWDNSVAAQLRNQLHLTDIVDLDSTASVNRYEVQPNTTLNVPRGPAAFGIGHVYALGMDTTVEEKFTVRPMKNMILTAGVAGSMLHVVTPVTGSVLVDPSKDLASQIQSVTYFTRKGDPSSRVSVMAGSATDFTNLGAYAEGTWRVLDDLKVIAGVRADKSSRIQETPVSPRLALIYDLSKELTVKYIFSRSFVAPELDIAYLAYSDPGHGTHIPNANLGPERATSNEVSVSYNDSHFGATVSGFHNQLNQIFTDVTVAHAFLDPAGNLPVGIQQAANQGEMTATGVDAMVKASFWRASVWASYSFVSLSNEDTLAAQRNGNGTSSNNYRLGTTVGWFDNLYTTVSLSARSRPTGVDVGALNEELGRIYEVNAYALYSPTKHVDLFADVRNATNNHYAVAGGFDPINTIAVPAQTFRAMAGVQLHY
jgi:outer membrane receptor protein involved in Fe transport